MSAQDACKSSFRVHNRDLSISECFQQGVGSFDGVAKTKSHGISVHPMCEVELKGTSLLSHVAGQCLPLICTLVFLPRSHGAPVVIGQPFGSIGQRLVGLGRVHSLLI